MNLALDMGPSRAIENSLEPMALTKVSLLATKGTSAGRQVAPLAKAKEVC